MIVASIWSGGMPMRMSRDSRDIVDARRTCKSDVLRLIVEHDMTDQVACAWPVNKKVAMKKPRENVEPMPEARISTSPYVGTFL